MTTADEAALAQLREAWAGMVDAEREYYRDVYFHPTRSEIAGARFLAAAIRLAEGEK